MNTITAHPNEVAQLQRTGAESTLTIENLYEALELMAGVRTRVSPFVSKGEAFVIDVNALMGEYAVGVVQRGVEKTILVSSEGDQSRIRREIWKSLRKDEAQDEE